MIDRLIGKLEQKVGRHRGIRNLMSIVVIGTVVVYLADYISMMVQPGMSLSRWLHFDKALIMRGQIWRLITFVFVPSGSANLLFLAIGLYFDWLMGELLQNHWGTFRFTLYYTVGMLGAVIAGCITGYTTAYYLNMSLMLAMACIQPDFPLRLYGVLEIRMKWLALLSVIMMALPLITSWSWIEFMTMAAALINVILFFGGRLIDQMKKAWRHYLWKRNWRSGWKR